MTPNSAFKEIWTMRHCQLALSQTQLFATAIAGNSPRVGFGNVVYERNLNSVGGKTETIFVELHSKERVKWNSRGLSMNQAKRPAPPTCS